MLRLSRHCVLVRRVLKRLFGSSSIRRRGICLRTREATRVSSRAPHTCALNMRINAPHENIE